MWGRAILSAAVATGLAACSPFGGGAFQCTEDTACGASGRCEPNGLCSFPDSTCGSGRRYGDAAGDLSGTCVGDEPDAATADGPIAVIDGPPGVIDAEIIDAALPVDASPPCDIAIDSSDSSAGSVGNSGGSSGPDLICPAGDEIIGVAARISNQNTTNGGRSAVGFTILCAALTTGGSGPTLGAETAIEVAGTGQFGWTPATQSELTRCPAGYVVTGLDGSSGATDDLFLDLTVTCGELGADGATTGVATSIYVNGTLDEPSNHDTATCPSGSVARRFRTRRGAGFDQATLHCAQPSCQ
jgi:hypothetical protein